MIGSPIMYLIVEYFLEDAFGALFCPFQRTVLQCSAGLLMHTLYYWTRPSLFMVLTCIVCTCAVTLGALVAHR